MHLSLLFCPPGPLRHGAGRCVCTHVRVTEGPGARLCDRALACTRLCGGDFRVGDGRWQEGSPWS